MKKNNRRKQSSQRKTGSKSSFFDFLSRGTQALQNGDIAQAMSLLERAHQLDPHNPDAALNLSGVYILAKKFARAVAILESLSERDPNNPMVWTNLGAAYLGNPILAGDEKQQRAIAAFEQALDINPATPNVAYNLGLIYLDRQEPERAMHWFRQAVQTNPYDRDAVNYIRQLSSDGTEDGS